MIAEFAFVFLVYVIVTTGYITEVLSCQMRHLLKTSTYFRHMLGVIMVFVFIMLEGGWSFDSKVDELAPTNWSSGNALHSIVIAFGIYCVFIISSKSTLLFNLAFFSSLLVMYVINTQRSYWHKREMIDDDTNDLVKRIEYAIFGFAVVVLIAGFVNYVFYQKADRGDGFNWKDFILGVHKCSNLSSNINR